MPPHIAQYLLEIVSQRGYRTNLALFSGGIAQVSLRYPFFECFPRAKGSEKGEGVSHRIGHVETPKTPKRAIGGYRCLAVSRNTGPLSRSPSNRHFFPVQKGMMMECCVLSCYWASNRKFIQGGEAKGGTDICMAIGMRYDDTPTWQFREDMVLWANHAKGPGSWGLPNSSHSHISLPCTGQ